MSGIEFREGFLGRIVSETYHNGTMRNIGRNFYIQFLSFYSDEEHSIPLSVSSVEDEDYDQDYPYKKALNLYTDEKLRVKADYFMHSSIDFDNTKSNYIFMPLESLQASDNYLNAINISSEDKPTFFYPETIRDGFFISKDLFEKMESQDSIKDLKEKSDLFAQKLEASKNNGLKLLIDEQNIEFFPFLIFKNLQEVQKIKNVLCEIHSDIKDMFDNIDNDFENIDSFDKKTFNKGFGGLSYYKLKDLIEKDGLGEKKLVISPVTEDTKVILPREYLQAAPEKSFKLTKKFFAKKSLRDDEIPEEVNEAFEEICKDWAKIKIKPEEFKCSNDLYNLIISITKGFETVITGAPGNGRGDLCKVIGTKLNPMGGHSRYFDISARREWRNNSDFYKFFESNSAPMDEQKNNLMELMTYEAAVGANSGRMFPWTMTIRNALNAPVDEYFSDINDINNRWYRLSENNQPLGDSKYIIPKALRVILSISDSVDGILSPDMCGKANVIDIDNPIELAEEMKAIPNDSLIGFYINNFPDEYEDEKDYNEFVDSNDKFIFNEVIDCIYDNATLDNKKILFETRRAENAIARYWVTAKDCMKDEKMPDTIEDVKTKYVPSGMVIDEDIIAPGEKISEGTIAMDYALSQRILSCITKVKGNISLSNPSRLVECLLGHRLLRCAKSLKDAIEIGKIALEDETSDKSNDELIIKKCNKLYEEIGKYVYRNREELIEHICELVNQFRDENIYTRNVIVNMLICLTQGFVTVFSGKPGCGKTSICRILGEVMGLTNMNENFEGMDNIRFNGYKTFEDRRNEIVEPSRYLEISTERGWTSKRDFIGYYNPLTEKFDKVNALLYNAFLVMDSEFDNQGEDHLPSIILLDEANLSPMEYYWADFMNLCEEWRESNSIDLGGGRIFRVPETLHFVATINNDHTTEILSPRLIDRANVIDLPVGEYKKIVPDTEISISPIPWRVLKDAFGCSENDAELFEDGNKETEDVINYNEIKEFVQGHFGILLSPRTDIAVSRYWTVAKACFSGNSYDLNKEALDRISEWIDDKEALDTYSDAEKKDAVDGLFRINGGTENETIKVDSNIQAMDYAIAQRVLPKLTDVSGENSFNDLVRLFIILVGKYYYKSAGIVADLIGRGYETGFYNYFR